MSKQPLGKVITLEDTARNIIKRVGGKPTIDNIAYVAACLQMSAEGGKMAARFEVAQILSDAPKLRITEKLYGKRKR